MTVVFACKPIHLKDDLFRATQLDHRFSEELVADESVMDVVIFLLATPLLKLICCMVLFASKCFPVPVTVWPALPYVKVRDGEGICEGEVIVQGDEGPVCGVTVGGSLAKNLQEFFVHAVLFPDS